MNYNVSVPISKKTSTEAILKKLIKYTNNPTPLDIKTKLPEKRSNVITIPKDLYHTLKSLHPNYPIECIIYSVCRIKEDELYYGGLLFKYSEGWEREKSIPDVGRIDGYNYMLNKIVELKFVSGWTHGLGQILAYSLTYPKMAKELWLLVDKSIKCSKEKKIINTCKHYGVEVKFIKINQ